MNPTGASVRAAALPFVASRAIVLVALEIARIAAGRPHASLAVRASAHAGLLGWDASWYSRIALLGYAGAGRGAVRFFPLLPLMARALAYLPAIDDGAALLIIANVACLGALALLHQLVLFETSDEAAARRAPWLLALFPTSFVLVMGYAESLLLLLAIACFLCLRSGRFAWAGLAGALAGLCRPVGLLLAVPALIEGLRGLSEASNGERFKRALAVAGPPAGTVVYLFWSKLHYKSFLLPFKEQVLSVNRGGVADPLVTLWHDALDLVHFRHLGTALHAPWALVLLFLALVVWRKWPAAYGAYATATLAVALTAPNLTSLERYGLGCFPFVLALTSVTARPWLRWAVLAGSAAMLLGYAVLAFTGAYVP